MMNYLWSQTIRTNWIIEIMLKLILVEFKMLLKTLLKDFTFFVVRDWDEVRQCTAKITPEMYLPVLLKTLILGENYLVSTKNMDSESHMEI